MKLATVGAVICVLGVAVGVSGLILSGAIWIACGLLARELTVRWAEQAPQPDGRAAVARPFGGGFARTTLVFLVIGVSSLAIGLLQIGFSEADREWSLIPIAIGALACGVVALGVLLNLTGSGLVAAGAANGAPEQLGTITIRAMRETGAFINGRPRIEFDLLVQPDGLPSYELTKRATVPLTALGSLRVGGGFRARVDGEGGRRIDIDWSAPVPE